jgi:hypothetical protein
MNSERNTTSTGLRKRGTESKSVSDLENSSKVLTQDELLRWWPFTRLDPKRFPKVKKTERHDDYEEALL